MPIVTIIACPAAAITMSASRTILSGSGVCEWTMVTVASAFSSSNETGSPTMLLRPTTTALLPFIVTPLRFRSSRHPCREKTNLRKKRKINRITKANKARVEYYCLGRARKEKGVSAFHCKLANVQRMKAINILLKAYLT